MKRYAVQFGVALLLAGLAGCGGGSTGSTGTAPASGVVVTPTISPISGVAQGPLVNGSIVAAQVVDATLTPTSAVPSSYTITSDLGTFSAPSSAFTGGSVVDLNATGKYFDEVLNAPSTGPVTLSSLNLWDTDTAPNVNILTTLAYQRVKALVKNNPGMLFGDARKQAETEVMKYFHIRDPFLDQNGNQINFGSLDLAKGGNGVGGDSDNFLAAISSLFEFGNTYGQVSALMANFQSDIADNGCIDTSATQNALINSANSVTGINPATVATHLTSKYSSASFLPTDISNWLDQDNDGVIGKFKFQTVQATSGTPYTFPIYTVGLSDDGALYSITNATFTVNSGLPTASASVKKGDSIVVTRTPGSHDISKVFLRSSVSLPCTPIITPTNVARYDFNPFAAAGSLTTARISPTVTLLQNGQVLVTGGLVAGTASSSAELYDPVTNQWAPAKSMTAKRVGHTATLLNNGQVLVVGGDTGATGTAELYDPGTNTWLLAANPVGATSAVGLTSTLSKIPAPPRAYHTATLLNDGTVLVAGGVIAGKPPALPVPTSSAERYVPADNVWTTVQSMSTALYRHTATLLQDIQHKISDMVLIAGGFDGNVAVGNAELFDPSISPPDWTPASGVGSEGAWNPAGNLSAASYSHSATLLQGGRVLITGGLGTAGTALSRAELFNPNSTTWSATTSTNASGKPGLITGRFNHIAQLLDDGAVLVAGGTVDLNGTYLSSAELYDPNGQLFKSSGNLAYARAALGAEKLLSGKVLMVGGQGVGGLGVNAAETFR